MCLESWQAASIRADAFMDTAAEREQQVIDSLSVDEIINLFVDIAMPTMDSIEIADTMDMLASAMRKLENEAACSYRTHK